MFVAKKFSCQKVCTKIQTINLSFICLFFLLLTGVVDIIETTDVGVSSVVEMAGGTVGVGAKDVDNGIAIGVATGELKNSVISIVLLFLRGGSTK